MTRWNEGSRSRGIREKLVRDRMEETNGPYTPPGSNPAKVEKNRAKNKAARKARRGKKK